MADHRTDIRFFNSLTRKKERFEPLLPGHVGMYVCGPTVYGDAHLGHAKSYVSFDVLARYLRHVGFKVRYVQNITDVGHLTDDADEGEDKIERLARLDRVHPMEIAERYTRSYMKDMEALKVRHANIYPRASGHIIEQIAIIRDLIEKGHAYEVNGSVYFSVKSWPDYGILSGRQIDEALEGTRVSTRSEKRDPRDFALWKKAEPGHILQWESPWGMGYPGWHIECSAMSTKYLGPEFDIHGGGIENMFPHHECEIAQSRAHGDRFARYWLHNNMINVGGQKMGKSLGNFVTLKDALEEHSPEAIRLFILGTHYRSPANYTPEGLAACRSGVERLSNCVQALREALENAPETRAPAPGDEALQQQAEEADRAFHAAMNDDLNTPVAIAGLFDFVRQVNGALAAREGLSRAALERAIKVFDELAEDVLGLLPPAGVAEGTEDATPFIDLLVSIRSACKARKAFDLADEIRDALEKHGVVLKDTREGTSWAWRTD